VLPISPDPAQWHRKRAYGGHWSLARQLAGDQCSGVCQGTGCAPEPGRPADVRRTVFPDTSAHRLSIYS